MEKYDLTANSASLLALDFGLQLMTSLSGLNKHVSVAGKSKCSATVTRACDYTVLRLV